MSRDRGTVRIKRSLGAFVAGMAQSSEGILALAGDQIYSLEPRLRHLAIPRLRGASYTDIVSADGAIWLVASDPDGLVRVGDNLQVTRYPMPTRLTRVFSIENELWILRSERRGVFSGPKGNWILQKFDARRGRLDPMRVHLACVPIPLAEGHTLWLASLCDGTLRSYSLALGRFIGRAITVPSGAMTAAVQARRGVLVTASGSTGKLSLIRLQRHEVHALGQASSPIVALSARQDAIIAVSQLGGIKRIRAD